jgi:hypothetical protein
MTVFTITIPGRVSPTSISRLADAIHDLVDDRGLPATVEPGAVLPLTREKTVALVCALDSFLGTSNLVFADTTTVVRDIRRQLREMLR